MPGNTLWRCFLGFFIIFHLLVINDQMKLTDIINRVKGKRTEILNGLLKLKLEIT